MNEADARARNRYFLIALARLVPSAGAVFGVVLIARATGIEHRILGTAIVLSALYVMAVLPRALARRWRSGNSE